MTNQVTGGLDITPPLAWSEVQPTGFMIMSPLGFPVLPGTRLTLLTPVEELLDRTEGTLHRYTFAALTAATPDIPEGPARQLFRDEVAAVIAAFPTHVFGTINRTIRFRGDQLDDNWRVRLNPDGTVRLQVANLNWVDV